MRNRRNSIQISWTQGIDEYDLVCHDNPLPSFLKAIEALAPHVCTLCEFPARDAAKIIPTGITCRGKDDSILALITAKKPVKKGNRVFNIATPILPMHEDADNPAADHMEPAEAKAIEKVIAEAERYVDGERAQGQIQFGEDGAPADKKEDKKEEADEGEKIEFPAEATS